MALQALNTMSGGQRVRVTFARVCQEKPQVLILDEPTNHLDIYSIDALTDALQNFKGAVVFITHNRNMLRDLSPQLVVVQNGTCESIWLNSASPGGWLLRSVFGATCDGVKGKTPSGMLSASPTTSIPARCTAVKTGMPSASPSTSTLARSAAVETKKPKQQQPDGMNTFNPNPRPVDGPLLVSEKEFLKCAKRIREILKLEELKKTGQLNKSQENKWQTKADALGELIEALKYLPEDSGLREKNEDLIS